MVYPLSVFNPLSVGRQARNQAVTLIMPANGYSNYTTIPTECQTFLGVWVLSKRTGIPPRLERRGFLPEIKVKRIFQSIPVRS